MHFIQKICVLLFLTGSLHAMHKHPTISLAELQTRTIPQIMAFKDILPKGEAEYIIGLKLYNGIKIKEPNMAAAFKQFEKAAALGNASATASLGQMYLHGEGTEKDVPAYFNCLKKAAELGCAPAQYNYGSLIMGSTLPGGFNAGYTWLQKAAAQQSGEALAALGVLAQQGIDAHGESIEPDNNKAFELFKQAAEKKSYLGIFNLAQLYKSGLACTENHTKARQLFDRIANSKEANARAFQALMYETGSGMDQCLEKALDLYIRCIQTAIDPFAALGIARISKKMQQCEESARTLLQEEEQKQLKEQPSPIPNTPPAPTSIEKTAASELSVQATDFDIAGETLKLKLNSAQTYEDGSIITAIDTEKNTITIYNPRDNSHVTLYANITMPTTKHITKLSHKLAYDMRIARWFNTNCNTDHTQQEAIERHSFAQRVDQIVQLFGNTTFFVKQDGSLQENNTLDGFITTQDNRTLHGRFEYAHYQTAQEAVVYHRFLHPRSRTVPIN